MARSQYTETVLVTNARRYEVDGNRGTSLQYISADYVEGRDVRGSEPVDGSGPFELFDELTVLPGIYEVTFARGRSVRNQSGKSKASFEPLSAQYVGAVDLENLLDAEVVKS